MARQGAAHGQAEAELRRLQRNETPTTQWQDIANVNRTGTEPQKALRVPFPLQWGQFLLGWDRSFQVFRQTGLEVDVEQMQNYCMELLA